MLRENFIIQSATPDSVHVGQQQRQMVINNDRQLATQITQNDHAQKVKLIGRGLVKA